MTTFFRIAALVVVATGWLQPLAHGQAVSLDFLTKPTLVECEPEGAEPCFRMKFDFVDATGKPVNVQLPPADQLASHVEVQIDGQNVKPFYAAATAAKQDQARPPQTALLLFDVSGSMLTSDLGGQSRFDAAKGAAAEYLKDFSDGLDQVAIVPFASRDVESTISAAHFVRTRAAAQAELDALPRPEARNNTALYSAVRTAVEVLRQQRQPGAEQPRLLLLTDGANDVHPQSGDDQGLLVGPGGLATAAAAVQQSGVDVLPIGLGDRHSIDEIAMARLGTRPPLITFDVTDLRKAFQLGQLSQNASLTVTIQAPESLGSRTLLAGRVLHFRARITLPDGSGPHPAIYIAIENPGPTYLSRHGIFLQTSPEATLLSAQLESENWCLSSNNGRFEAAGILRPHGLNAGQHRLQWLRMTEETVAIPAGTETPPLPGGFWRGKCFVLPSIPAQRHFLCDVPHGLEAPLRAVFERPGLFIRPRAWLRIQLDPRVEALHTAISAVYLHAQSASNVECSNQTVHFTESGTTIPVSRETGGRSFLVAPLSITGESGETWLPEFQPSFSPGIGRYRLHQGYLTLMPGKISNGADETYANVRLWMTAGAAGNQMGVARLQSFAKEPLVRGLSVENITAAAGGSDGEGLHSAQRRFAEALLSRQRLLTRADLEVSIRSFDRRITRIDVHPILARSARGLRRLHRITVMAGRDRFAAPEEEARALVSDLHSFLAERVPLDVDVKVELAWT